MTTLDIPLKQSQYESQLLISPSKKLLPDVLHPLIHQSFLVAERKCQTTFTIALSGGSLPSFLSSLPQSFVDAGIDPQWDKWHVILADERLVYSSHEDSNIKALKEKFLDQVPIPSNQIYGIDESLLLPLEEESTSSKVTVHEIATEYEERVLQPILESRRGAVDASSGADDSTSCLPIVLDCVLLGFGPDGHTCSLFAGHPLLVLDPKEGKLVAALDDSPKPPPKRITLTLKVLNEMSCNVIFCGAGESKGPILNSIFDTISKPKDENKNEYYKAFMKHPAPYPCGMVRPNPSKGGTLHWVVDADAAKDLDLTNE